MLDVTVYAAVDDDEPTEFTDIDFVSLVSGETYGPPALVAPSRDRTQARAGINDRVLYINTRFVPMFEIVRTSD